VHQGQILLSHSPDNLPERPTNNDQLFNNPLQLGISLGDHDQEVAVGKADWRDRARYAFDNVMAKGTPALVGLLGLASAVLVVVVASLAWVLTPTDTRDNGNWLGVLWRALLRTMDPGTMGGDEGSPVYLLLMFLVTLGGIFIVSALISVLTTGLDVRLAQLSKGRSRILERDHTVLLGWSDQVFIVLSELVKANESVRRPCVAILADLDRVEMEEMIRQRLGSTGNTRVICRRGNPLKSSDVDLVSPETARSIIVLAPPVIEPDADVIKILLSLAARPWADPRPPVVAAVADSGNLAAALLAGGDEAHVIDGDELGIRLLVQSHRQSGLYTVCVDLLDFDDNEIYLHRDPRLAGRTFGEALGAFREGLPLGLRSEAGVVRLNPPMDAVIEAGDDLVLLAEDDTRIIPAVHSEPINEDAITALPPLPPPATNTLMLGWNHRGPKIVRLLDSFAEPGSRLVIASEHPDPTGRQQPPLLNMSVDFVRCDLNDRVELEKLQVGGFEHLIVLSDDTYEPQHADARTLVTLLHLRDMQEKLGEHYSIVTEMNDDANREVAEVTKADDFVVSTKLISLYLTQLSENRQLVEVFAALFDPEGAEIHLKPAANYVCPGAPVNFATVLESAGRRGETAIGYRRGGEIRRPPQYGVQLNPDKAAPLILGAEDQVIVLADT
jgi:voltage-gated potassium channel Kch